MYISLNNGEFVRCECKKDGVKANISFDLYTSSCNHDLTQVAQEHLHNEHQAYIKNQFFAARYKGTIHNMFFGTDIYFDVLYGDAEEWFQKILATLNEDKNLQLVKLNFNRISDIMNPRYQIASWSHPIRTDHPWPSNPKNLTTSGAGSFPAQLMPTCFESKHPIRITR